MINMDGVGYFMAMQSVLRHPAISAWSYEISGLAANDLSSIGSANLSRLAGTIRDYDRNESSTEDKPLLEHLDDLASTAVSKPLLPFLRDSHYAELGDRMIVYFPNGSREENIPYRTFVKDLVVAEKTPKEITLGMEGIKVTKTLFWACPYLLTEGDFNYLASGIDLQYSHRWPACQLTGPYQIDHFSEDLLCQIKESGLFSLKPEDLND